ncbi:MAG TPA: hypothetical protein VGS28_00650 [Candidatus Saccharimonadales bacterium]|nr:hypothetical protein [Candidatus Saccharimonadales bacterium]
MSIIKSRHRIKKWRVTYRAITVVAALSLALIVPAAAWASSVGQNAALSQGFTIQGSPNNFVPGALVSTTTNGSHVVQLANSGSADRIVGVIAANPLIQLSLKGDTTQVVINGTADVFVSDLNGKLKVGDKITSSPIDGVGMKATSSTQIVGTALAAFNSNTAVARTINSSGHSQTVHIEQVPVQINVAYYQSLSSSVLPPFIQDLANTIAGKPVSVVRVMLATIILLVAFISIFALLYTATRSGITSIGRNPLSAKAITRNLRSVGLVTVVVLAVSLGAVYLILTA